MCQWGTDKMIEVEGKKVAIDSCIAGLILKLNKYGIKTIGSCCGHGKNPLSILFKLDNKTYQITEYKMNKKGREISCKCQGCGTNFKVDLIIPDDLWEKIRPLNEPKGAGILCGKCIMEKIEKISNYDVWFLTKEKDECKSNSRRKNREV